MADPDPPPSTNPPGTLVASSAPSTRCRLLELPTELRLDIYDLIIIPPICPPVIEITHYKKYLPIFTLPAICRQIRAETLDLQGKTLQATFWRTNKFHFSIHVDSPRTPFFLELQEQMNATAAAIGIDPNAVGGELWRPLPELSKKVARMFEEKNSLILHYLATLPKLAKKIQHFELRVWKPYGPTFATFDLQPNGKVHLQLGNDRFAEWEKCTVWECTVQGKSLDGVVTSDGQGLVVHRIVELVVREGNSTFFAKMPRIELPRFLPVTQATDEES